MLPKGDPFMANNKLTFIAEFVDRTARRIPNQHGSMGLRGAL